MKAKRSRHTAAFVACASVMTAASALAAAPAYPTFPTGSTLPEVAAWVRANTSLDLGAVVGVGADSIFALEPTRETAAPPAVRATIRQEVINAAFAVSLGGRSAVMVADIDCGGRRVFQRALDLYAGNNRQGAVRRLGAASDWQDVPRGTFMDGVVAAICDLDYQPIFPAGQVPEAAPASGPVAALTPRRRSPASLAPPRPVGPPIPLIAPAAPTPRAVAAPTPAPAPAPQLARTARSPAPRAVAIGPTSPDGPIITQALARPALIAPPAASPSPVAALPPAPAQPIFVAAAPSNAAAPTPSPARAAPTATALGLRPLALGRAEIGSYPSADAAIAAWRYLAAANPAIMAGKRQHVELSTAGVATRFRAFVDGFSGRGEAEAFCRTITAQGRACTAAD
jgi:hypothetical protein